MAETKEDVLAALIKLCAPLGAVTGKAMFGGLGVFCEGSMFALITRAGELYFKADDENRATYEHEGLAKYGKMPYYRAPENVLTGWRVLKPWVSEAYRAAQAAPKKNAIIPLMYVRAALYYPNAAALVGMDRRHCVGHRIWDWPRDSADRVPNVVGRAEAHP